MEDFVKQALLYDFYGDLLTEHQRSVYSAYVLENLSISEIAREAGISRQGVHDMLKRCNGILEEYERKLQLVERFIKIKDRVRLIADAKDLEEARNISNGIMELL
ncbi:MAG: YlxM family DNA-binding protein [Lachnospiraceae bacterium]